MDIQLCMFWWFLHGLHNIHFTGSHENQCRFCYPWIRAEVHHCGALWKIPSQMSNENLFGSLCLGQAVFLCQKRPKFCPMALKDLACMVLHHCSVFRKEKGLKNKRRVAVYTWQWLYVVTCWFCLQITVISPSEMEEVFVFCFLSV